MKHIPILFSTPMVQAILAGRKTQTRRVVKPQPEDGLHNHTLYPMSLDSDLLGFWGVVADTGETKQYKNPYGQPGDVLWVRECWSHANNELGEPVGDSFDKYLYKADGDTGKFKPSIHMPKQACRLFLRITNVRVERLQDISEKEAMAEGVKEINVEIIPSKSWYNYLDDEQQLWQFNNSVSSFKSLWESINGPDSWQVNPYVWVIEFERIDKPNKWPLL